MNADKLFSTHNINIKCNIKIKSDTNRNLMTKQKIFTSYYGKYRTIPAEYQCISISNSKPSSICIPKWSEVVPPWNIIVALKNGKITGKQFAKHYYNILAKRPPNYYKDYLDNYGITAVLLCWEENAFSCHRYLLSAYLTYICEMNIMEYDSYVTTMPKNVFYRLLEGE